jgi:hypothetical protein
MNKTENAVKDLYLLSAKLNDISGASQELTAVSLNKQFALIQEEFSEMKQHIGVSNAVGSLFQQDLTLLLDDCADILVTTFGFLQKLENLGVDVSKALTDTGYNNLTKFPRKPAVAHATVEMYKQQGVDVTSSFNEEHNCFVIRDNQGKIRKPQGFLSNDLSGCVPTIVVR